MADTTETTEVITITIDVPDNLKIGDFKKLDRMFGGKAGSFSEGMDMLQSWVKGVNLDDLYPEELESIIVAVREEMDTRTNRKNSVTASRRILSARSKNNLGSTPS